MRYANHSVASAIIGVLVALPAGAACNSQCLSKVMDIYLAQLVKHDPSPLKVTANINARENGEAVKLGDGSWQTITRLPAGQTFADASTGEAVHFGATMSNGQPGSLFLRLKIAAGKIAESEMFTKGGEPGAGNDVSGLLEPDILYDAEVPAARRSTRAELVNIVNHYMDAIGKHDGKLAAFSYRCDRYSAGGKFTNSPAHPLDRGGGSCETSLNNLQGQSPVNRRIAVVDVDRGVVGALFIIPHAERTPQGATNVAEIFKIVDGKIRSIEEFSFVAGFPPSSGFPDPPGN